MDTSRESDGRLIMRLSQEEQRALAAAVARAIGMTGTPTNPVIQAFADRLSQYGPRTEVCFEHVCPEWAGPLSIALGDYATHAAAVTHVVGREVASPEFTSYIQNGPVAETLALEMACAWGTGHSRSTSA